MYVDFPQQNAIYSSTGKALTDMTHVCIHRELLPNEQSSALILGAIYK